MPIQLAIIGYGGMGSYHANDILTKETCVNVRGCFDIKADRKAQIEADGHYAYASLAELLMDATVEAVLVATPNDSHKELTLRSLQAGKHVICEKPVALSVVDFAEMTAAAEKNQRCLFVHQNRRWDADFLIMRELYQQQRLGAIFQLESRVHGANGIPGDWRRTKAAGGGMLLDWGVHLLDQLLFLVDSPIKTISADFSYILGDEVDDGFVSYLTFANGLKAVIEVGTTNYIKLPRWYAKGVTGTALIQDWDLSGELVLQTDNQTAAEPKPIQAGQGLTKTMAPPSEEATKHVQLPKAPTAEYPTFYQNVYAVIREQAEPIVKNREVKQVLELMAQIATAAQTGETIHLS